MLVALAGFSPWLFELGRVAFEVAMEPLLLCLALLGVERASRLDRWNPPSALPVSVAIGAITYVYAVDGYLLRFSPRRSSCSSTGCGGSGSSPSGSASP